MNTDRHQKSVSAIALLFFAGISLVIGHLLLQQYMPNAGVGVLAFIMLMLIFGYVMSVRHDIFGFVMMVYICSHFSYGDNHGGLWNIVAFSMSIICLLENKKYLDFNQPNLLINILLGTLIFFNVLGWALNNPMPIIPLMEGATAFLGYMLIFQISSKIRITADRVRIFLAIVFFLLIYMLAIALNQNYSLIDTGSPMLGGNTLTVGKVTESGRPMGTLGHFELFSEYALLMMCLIIPLISSSTLRDEIKFSRIVLMLSVPVCISIFIITSMRGAFILSIAVTAFYYLIFPLRIIKAIDKIRQQAILIMLVALLLPAVSIYIGLEVFKKDLANVNVNKMNVENVVSGQSINRGGLVQRAIRRWNNESWIVGFGSGTSRSNSWALFGVDPDKRQVGLADYHNLYVALPMLYGWIGSFAFLGIILITLARLLSVTLKYRSQKSFLLVLSFGLTIMWAAFLVHEYKISILRNANYQMLFWIWMGISTSVVKTIKEKWSDVKVTEKGYGNIVGAVKLNNAA